MTETYGRQFNQARKQQGFKSQAQLDAFFAHLDHTNNCPDCKALDGGVWLNDGYQLTVGQCPVAKQLDAEYFKFSTDGYNRR